MEHKVQSTTRESIKKSVNKWDGDSISIFKLIYSHDNMIKPIGDVIDSIPDEQLNDALVLAESFNKRD
jgi:hypothetical protein